VLFLGLYLINHYAVLRLYAKLLGEKAVGWQALLMLSLSYRVHSIFLLRMFNDPVAITLMHWSVLYMTENKWIRALLLYSAALSVKMNILLYLPGVLLLLLLAKGPAGLMGGIGIICALQGLLAAPFLASFPMEYFSRAFEFSRQFDMKWSVNYQFLSLEAFSNPHFHLLLLCLHLSLLLVFLLCHGSAGSTLSQRLRSLNCSLYPQETQLSASEIVKTLFTVNLIGIACCRSLHYQFYSWYFYTLPLFVWSESNSNVLKGVMLGCWVVLEGVYMRYPPSEIGSLGLQLAHWTLVVSYR